MWWQQDWQQLAPDTPVEGTRSQILAVGFEKDTELYEVKWPRESKLYVLETPGKCSAFVSLWPKNPLYPPLL